MKDFDIRREDVAAEEYSRTHACDRHTERIAEEGFAPFDELRLHVSIRQKERADS